MFQLRFSPSSKFVSTALCLCLLSAVLAGCGGGGSGGGATGPNPFVPATDLHGDTLFTATRIFPDNGFIIGAINTGADLDVFSFNVTAGVTYAIQVELDGTREAFTPLNSGELPMPSGDDMNDINDLILFVVDNTQTTVETSVNEAGSIAYDKDVAGLESDDGLLGDSRIVFVAEATERLYLVVGHIANLTGTGNYVLTLSSSQLGFVAAPTDESELEAGELREPGTAGEHQGGLHVKLETDDEPPVTEFEGLVKGAIGPMEMWYPGSTFNFEIRIAPPIILGDNDTPEEQAIHIHVGFPHLLPHLPNFSDNLTAGDEAHDIVADLSDLLRRSYSRGEKESLDIEWKLPDGSRFTVPVESELLETYPDGSKKIGVHMRLGEAEALDRETINPGLVFPRLVVGYPWYIDAHIITDFERLPNPYVVSYPYGDIYGIFETEFDLAFQNVVGRNADTSRGVGRMSVFLDNSLMVFQILNNELELVVDDNGSPDDPTDDLGESAVVPVSNPFQGRELRVFRGGINQTGSLLFDLGLIPMRKSFEVYQDDPSQEDPLIDVPGLRTPIRRLTTSEMQTLRQSYYSGGWYMEARDPINNFTWARMDGSFWEIQTNPNDAYPNPVRSDSPAYEFGYANFVSEYTDGGEITVIANGKIIGVLDQAVSDDTMPLCGEESIPGLVASDRFIPQAGYPYRAIAEDGTEWTGEFSVEDGGCNTVILSAP